MSDSTGEPERLAEILREIIALSQTGRPNNLRTESKNEVEAARTNKSGSADNEFERTSDARDRQAGRAD
jgi:hypothetical protein